MRFQQNLTGRQISVIVLDIHPIAPVVQLMCLNDLLFLIPTVEPGQGYVIEGPHPNRDR
jgi:hypothetical protein